MKIYFFLITAGALLLCRPVRSQSVSFSDSAALYLREERYDKAVYFSKKWKDEALIQYGENSTGYASALNTLGFCLTRNSQYAEGDSVLRQCLAIRKRLLGESDPDVATTLSHLGNVYFSTGNYSDADSYYRAALQIRIKALGESHLDLATSYRNLGMVRMVSGDLEAARPFMEKYLELSIRLRPEKDPELATAYHYTGYYFLQTGHLPKAEEYFKKALFIRKLVFPETHPQLAESYQMMGVLWNEKGNFGKAEDCFQKSLGILTLLYGPDAYPLNFDINNLATLYYEMGLYTKAEPFYQRAISICRQTEGDSSVQLPVLYTNLGNLYDLTKQPEKARACFEKSLSLQLNTVGQLNPHVAWTYLNIGVMQMGLNQYHLAEASMTKALSIWKQTLGENHSKVSYAYQNLGSLAETKGDLAAAEAYYRKNVAIQKKHLGILHPDMAISFQSLASYYYFRGQDDKAEYNFLLSRNNLLHQVTQIFPYLTDGEKEKFLMKVEPVQAQFNAFCVRRYFTRPAISGDLYNHQLATKAILLQSAAKWKHRIRTSGDTLLTTQFEVWESNHNLLAKLLQSTDSLDRAQIDSLQKVTDLIEKTLSRRSEAFARLAEKKPVTWKEVQRKLKPGEAAIEMIRLQTLGLTTRVIDSTHPKKPSYQIQGLTDTIHYAALIVKSTSKYPEIVLLKNGNDLEKKYINFYKNQIQQKLPDSESYPQFWEKIDSRLKGIKTIWFSPDGVYHNLNPSTLINPKTKKPLLEEKDIRVVTVTRDLVNGDHHAENPNLAYLFGFANFEAPFEHEKNTVALRNRSPELDYHLDPHRDKKVVVDDLPATKIEVERISDLLSAKGWEVFAMTREKALEASLKESFKPRLLHIATHGFFNAGDGQEGNPLLRSGLLLASAANALNGRKPESSDDGILTAYEAMNLNLDNTDLVVLSACETGLGEIKNGEGVYGLQRAFKVAGAKTLIMSLWKVDDEATQELMVSFYKHWLSPQTPGEGLDGNKASDSHSSPRRAGRAKRSAFLAAQKELKAKYPNPYYWGAFVMVGE